MSKHPPNPESDHVVAILLANHRRFLDFLATRVRSREDAEEILQDAFVRGVQKSGEIRDEESTVAWFYRLLRNAITDYHRRHAAGQRAMEAVARSTEHELAPEEELERVVCACINDLIPTLKPEYAELIRRVDLGEESVGSLAEDLGMTAGNARVRLHRAREALRREVERSCRTCATHGCLDCTCSSPKKEGTSPAAGT